MCRRKRMATRVRVKPTAQRLLAGISPRMLAALGSEGAAAHETILQRSADLPIFTCCTRAMTEGCACSKREAVISPLSMPPDLREMLFQA